jgi:hypothetical protein
VPVEVEGKRDAGKDRISKEEFVQIAVRNKSTTLLDE